MCFEYTGRIDQCGPGIKRNCDTQRFGDLVQGGTVFNGFLGVDGDAPVAARGDGNGQGNQLVDFGFQIAFLAAALSIVASPRSTSGFCLAKSPIRASRASR